MSTTTDLQTKFAEIKTLVLAGKAMEAFEKYYGDDVVMQENENPATTGKAANRDRELDFLAKITDFRGSDCLYAKFCANCRNWELFISC